MSRSSRNQESRWGPQDVRNEEERSGEWRGLVSDEVEREVELECGGLKHGTEGESVKGEDKLLNINKYTC